MVTKLDAGHRTERNTAFLFGSLQVLINFIQAAGVCKVRRA
jgi:hypothetical protein